MRGVPMLALKAPLGVAEAYDLLLTFASGPHPCVRTAVRTHQDDVRAASETIAPSYAEEFRDGLIGKPPKRALFSLFSSSSSPTGDSDDRVAPITVFEFGFRAFTVCSTVPFEYPTERMRSRKCHLMPLFRGGIPVVIAVEGRVLRRTEHPTPRPASRSAEAATGLQTAVDPLRGVHGRGSEGVQRRLSQLFRSSFS